MSSAADDDELPPSTREALLRAGVTEYAQLEALFEAAHALGEALGFDAAALDVVRRRTEARGPFKRRGRCPWCSCRRE